MAETVLDINEIIKNLYLGSWSAAKDIIRLKAGGITHILTVNNSPLPKSVSEQFKYKFIHGFDLEFTDLLNYFEECIKFIDEGIRYGSVLVHCLAGCSRSATMVIAYLMKKKQMGYGEALGFVRQRRSIVHPNEGFKDQLLLYEEMGNTIDTTNERFRRYRLKKLALKIHSYDLDETFSPDELTANPSESDNKDIVYKCKKCRQALFKKSGLITHYVGEGEAAFDWRSRIPASRKEAVESGESTTTCRQSLFIEPVRWMADSISEPLGKLSCPKCSSKIGSFVWHGEKCPCGAWVAPAFHIRTNKVDESKPFVLLAK
ncbi:dual specificity protein phosphatase 12-like [Pecten maximus]|uniref:dual specificity protein phosphatase 12-like n=1 Tax=Pecten maximus TaxID=6579 RepID=UPI001458638C|nr:dual specificity protein phosphatase 12-like [Pecten maximus]